VVGHERASSLIAFYDHPNTPSHFTGCDRQQTAATAAHDPPNICLQSARSPFVNTDSQSAARLPPSPGYRNVLVENSVHLVYDAASRDEQVPTFRNNVLPSPSWFKNPLILQFATTDLTEDTYTYCYQYEQQPQLLQRCARIAVQPCSLPLFFRAYLGFLTVIVSLLLFQVSGYLRALPCLGMKAQPERRPGNAYE
jgi:hypothetical protein